MTDVVRIWVEISHHAAFRCGGWAFVRQDGPALSGAAGGDRAVTPERAVLGGLAETLKDLPGGVWVEVYTSNRDIIALPQRIAGFAAGDDAPTADLDLWAQVSTALKAIRIVPAASLAGTPTAFAAAWAELARDKAKATGGFRSPIPKPNLAKAGV